MPTAYDVREVHARLAGFFRCCGRGRRQVLSIPHLDLLVFSIPHLDLLVT
jgi:hypothetical protein